MSGASSIIAVLAGAVLGGLAGWGLGRRVKGDRRGYWWLNAAAVIGFAGLNFAGLTRGLPWLASGAIGLMGGAITGLKYGYAPSSGIWRSGPPPAAEVAAEPDADPVAEDAAEPDAASGNKAEPGAVFDAEAGPGAEATGREAR